MTSPLDYSRRSQRIDLLGKAWTAPFLLFLAALLAYGWMLPTLGFYWDDWPKAWFLHLLGPRGFHAVYAVDRPFLAFTYLVTTPLFGETPLAWHLFALLTSWASAVALWQLVRTVWPREEWLAFGSGLLLLVYPGFTQQSIGLIYSHYYLILTTFLLSLLFMLKAVKTARHRFRFLMAAMAFSTYSHFSIEYFVGLEILRPLLVWWALAPQGRGGSSRFLRTLGYLLPFLLVDGSFLLWRVVVVEFPTYEPLVLDRFFLEPLATLGNLIPLILVDLFEVSLLAWAKAFRISDLFQSGMRGGLFSMAAIVLTMGMVAVLGAFLIRADEEDGETADRSNDRRTGLQVLLAGALAMFGAGWPFWLTGLSIEIEFTKDRFTLPMIIGAGWAILGGMSTLFQNFRMRHVLLAVLVGLGAGRQVYYGNEYRLAWEIQSQFFWQMSWRIPDLQEGTTILTNDFPTGYFSDNSLTAPLNWMYAPDHSSVQMPYMLYFLSVRLGRGLPRLEVGLPIYQAYRAASFEGSTSKILVLMYDPPGCLHVLDRVLDEGLTGKPEGFGAAIPLSNLALIQTDPEEPKQPPPHIFGAEPEHGWCYYYQTADLARQQGNWQEIVRLGDIAFALDDRPNNASERTPFIEGYAHTGQWKQALELSKQLLADQPQMNRLVCNTWSRILRQTGETPAREEVAAEIQTLAECDL